MRHRMGGVTGIGNPAPEVLDGKSTGSIQRDNLINQCAKDCYLTFFKGTKLDYDTCDAGVTADEVRLGIEPAYKDWPVKLIVIDEEKRLSYIETGIARGWYGSEWQSTKRYYQDYKYASKFKRFVDKWHPRLWNTTPTPINQPKRGKK